MATKVRRMPNAQGTATDLLGQTRNAFPDRIIDCVLSGAPGMPALSFERLFLCLFAIRSYPSKQEAET